MTTPLRAFLRLFVLAAIAVPASAQTKLLRFPDVHQDRVVFCYAGDLWLAPSAGGLARRLTAHPGLEIFPKFSPDGAWIAFTGQYDGDEQVYVVSAEGGVPRQLTWYPARGPLPPRWGWDNQVYGWTSDGKSVLFRSMRDGWTLTATRLFTVPFEGGLPVALPMPVSGGGDISPDGKKVVYSPLTRDFRTWKRYQGGWAQDLYVYDLATAALEPVAHTNRTERDPMWIGNSIYFASDRTGTLNLFRYDVGTKAVEQVTNSTGGGIGGGDVRWPSKGASGEIVYELDGELWIYDTAKKASRAVPIRVPDDGVASRPSRVSAADEIESFALAPKAERALFVARGDVFTAPIEKGPTRNLTRSCRAHDKGARWSPDGRRIAFLSDRDGEEELYLVDQDGSGEPVQLTDGGSAMRYAPAWSPDGARLAFSDKDGRLYVVEVESKQMAEVARDDGGELGDFTWSPAGDHLAFSLSNANGNRSLYIWTVAGGGVKRVTDDTFSAREPVWDPKGSYLYYLSDREYAPLISNREWNFAGNRTTGIFCLALRADVEHPFPPESDEVDLGDEKKKGEGDEKKDEEKGDAKEDAKERSGEKDEKEAKEPLRIDFDGLAARAVRVPVEADNYSSLTANEGHLVYVRGAPFYYGRESDRKNALMVFSIEKREAKVLLEDVGGYATSLDGSKLLVAQGGAYHLIDAKPGGADSKKTVSTGGLSVDRVPKEEWAEIFDEVWRRFRDFFYVENMHGYDWAGLRERYRPLVEHVGHRSDLNYVLGEMVSELNVGHAYIAGGDWQAPERPAVALPGCRFELDPASRRYKVAKIFRGQNEEERYRSPLTEVGSRVEVGEYVLAVDGVDLAAPVNPYALLRGKADRAVELLVSATPARDGARKVTFRPLRSETDLLYLEMVLQNQERVSQLSGGRFGYVHLPNMGADGIREFIKWFYPQIRKEGLIVDVRENGGGNVSQILLERLRRTLLGTTFSRTSAYTGTYPETVFHGKMACILNQNSASDGDIFPWMFREAGLGPLIGKRSWGGVVGISDHGPLIDGGGCSVPEFGHADREGHWAVEGWGVEPDIEVENDPRAVIDGRDPQLERAVAEVQAALAKDPQSLPMRPPDPVKTK